MPVWSSLTNKAYLRDNTVTNIFQSFAYKMAAKTSWHSLDMERNHVLSPYAYWCVACIYAACNPAFADVIATARNADNDQTVPTDKWVIERWKGPSHLFVHFRLPCILLWTHHCVRFCTGKSVFSLLRCYWALAGRRCWAISPARTALSSKPAACWRSGQ